MDGVLFLPRLNDSTHQGRRYTGNGHTSAGFAGGGFTSGSTAEAAFDFSDSASFPAVLITFLLLLRLSLQLVSQVLLQPAWLLWLWASQLLLA